ncbi:kinase-like domain-containing protein [Gigaspora rosea]|uniref:Kinase-like domain-containing protein n=1 Tax=Gigaspora rosea TaxID=44941 RepID=A0A397VEV2_9GLOM|nr:kinase-like domain-containing protein [Gigaspora rosea]
MGNSQTKTRGVSTNESFKRYKAYGKCHTCKHFNTNVAWCQLCDPKKLISQFEGAGGSGDQVIDDFLEDLWIHTEEYEKIVEWIPFERFEGVQEIGKGGFSYVYSATWVDGLRKLKSLEADAEQTRTGPSVVALKSITKSDNLTIEFLKEFRHQYYNCIKNKLGKYFTFYGITYHPTKKEYMLVIDYADRGDLRSCLTNSRLYWSEKLQILTDVSFALHNIHHAEYVHKDLHSGNILCKTNNVRDTIVSYISDLGLSNVHANLVERLNQKNNYSIYGVLPYISPEVLCGQEYTSASDIYSLGVIMSELSTNKPPFFNLPHNQALALKICDGLRPGFSKNTPECYIKLANQCMDMDPEKRPTAEELRDKFWNWNEINQHIKKQFDDADRQQYEEEVDDDDTLQIHPEAIYICRVMNLGNLNEIGVEDENADYEE